MSIIRYAVVETFLEKISCDVWAGGRGGGRLEAERGMTKRVKGQVSESRSVGTIEKEENPPIFVTWLSLWPLILHAGNVQSSVGGVRADYLQGYFRRWKCRPTSIVQLMHVAYTTGLALITQYSSVVGARQRLCSDAVNGRSKANTYRVVTTQICDHTNYETTLKRHHFTAFNASR